MTSTLVFLFLIIAMNESFARRIIEWNSAEGDDQLLGGAAREKSGESEEMEFQARSDSFRKRAGSFKDRRDKEIESDDWNDFWDWFVKHFG